MRDYLLFYINGIEHRVNGENAFIPLSSYLRQVACAMGTKVVCEEGDCGACSVLAGHLSENGISYRTINSCIQYLYQVDGLHIVTIEGLKSGPELNAVQDAMVKCHGTQCGYCTPGFVVAMCGMFDQRRCGETKERASAQDIKDALTGNLCRCTGYVSIIESGLQVDQTEVKSLHELYPPDKMKQVLAASLAEEVDIVAPNKRVYIPVTLEQAVRFKAENKNAIIVSGGTDVCVNMNKREYEPAIVMSFSRIGGLSDITIQDDTLAVGGTTTLTKLEEFAKENIPELHHLLWLFGSPQIRNAGTLAGNIANASPIADTPPFLFVMDAQLELSGSNGTRIVEITKFYKGYKQFDLNHDEIISRILIPLPKPAEIIKLYKVSKRTHLDISSFTAAFRLKLNGDNIESAAVCYGGVGPVVLRMPATEEFLQGKPFSVETFLKAGDIAVSEITPISDVRGSKEFRNQLGRNILVKFFHEVRQTRRESACLS